MEVLRSKKFKNGIVYCLKLDDGMLVETTDTFLPYYTKDAIGRKQNKLDNTDLGNRSERWMIGVSTMSGCPVRCKFCATGNMKRYRNLTADEIVEAGGVFAFSGRNKRALLQGVGRFLQRTLQSWNIKCHGYISRQGYKCKYIKNRDYEI